MFQKINTIAVATLLFAMIFSSCSDYQKVLKSSDYEWKYQKAKEYYDEEDYIRAINLFEELLTIYKGTSKAEDLYYYYAYCHYHQLDYILAGHYFRSFFQTFPFSKNAEEAEYLSAFCYYKDSPSFSLDQTYTLKAIEEMQLFINKHPESERVKEANGIIDKLRFKLEKKSYENASLYYHIGDYKAAITALKNSLKEFPDTEYREEIMFLTLKSSFLLADKSVISKKKDRYENAKKEFATFKNAYPESKKMKDAAKFEEKIMQYLAGENI